MKTIIQSVCTFLFLLLAAAHCGAAEWLTDFDLAQKKAQAEHKAIFLDFTGSDWCHWCMKLKSEVFDQPEFASYADANLILVEVDFPHRTQLSAAQQAANHSLAQKYGIQGYPSVIVLNSSGEQIGRTGYHPGGPKAFISDLEKMPGMKPSVGLANKVSEPSPPQFVPVVPNHYDQLALKGISGSATRRMALINGETFLAGETSKVRVKDGKVDVTCKEIRIDSVLLTVEGKTLELKLAHP